MKYSILIPLEFHRGVAVECIQRWVGQATTMPSDTEVLVSASVNHDAEELAEIQGVLRPDDRLLQCNSQHDIPLVHHAARQANGQYLVFTESHCAPVDGFLQQTHQVLAEHPDWVGFSGLSIPWTHNRLSEIEAAMYNRDIQHQLNQHPWLKVLDQCFVVLRSAYNSVGGMEQEYGHFAEWLLAARFADRGMSIGHDSRSAIRHRYCGDFDELETFTIDFAQGEIRYADHTSGHQLASRFNPPLAWRQRYSFDSMCFRQATQTILKDSICQLLTREGWRSKNQQPYPWPKLMHYLRQRYLGHDARFHWQKKMKQLKECLIGQLNDVSPSAASETFRQWLYACVQYGYADYLAEWSSTRRNGVCVYDERESYEPADPALSIASASLPLQRLLGFHADEVVQSEAFCWLEPLSMFRLNKGVCQNGEVVFEWASFASPSIRHELRFYFNGRRVPDRRIEHIGRLTSLHFDDVTSWDRSIRQASFELPLTITCIGPCLPASPDIRSLCIPLVEVFWKPQSDAITYTLPAA